MTKGKIKEGKIVQVIGPVIDIEFEEGDLPTLYNAVKLTNTRISDKEGNLIAEVAQHIGENTVRCIAMDTTDGLVRGMKAVDTGAPIAIPVGKGVLGRILNVIGEPVDEGGPVVTEKSYRFIARPPPF
jgi:F-type H+-transporting ATPase subunit beta